MVYDQAQSPRLVQRTPVESTYVQIFDVNPDTGTPDLPESAYPGQLIFRQDLGILQIWDFAAGTWLDVAGGVAGQLTYVGPEAPTKIPPDTFNTGDVWYDSDAGYKTYIWDGSAWVPGVTGIHTYYETGFNNDPAHPDYDATLGYVPDPSWEDDPDDPNDVAPPLLFPITGQNVGDIWYQLDDRNRMRRWTGSAWVDVRDVGIDANAAAIQATTLAINELNFLASSAQNSADTADGRVSMSDYEPGPDDLVYQTGVDDEGNPIFVDRVNGSIWFTRTRPRKNLCTNPSFETNENFWSASQATKVRTADMYVPAGFYTLRVTNNATVGDHYVAWGESARQPCAEGQVFTASIFAELLSGVGAGVQIKIAWYNSAGTIVGYNVGDPTQLVVNAWDPAVAGTITEPRLYVVGPVPNLMDVTSFTVQVVSPAGNEGDVWQTGALLVEAEDDLGRYFDGDSYDGYWDPAGTPHNTTSALNGDKITRIYELRDGDWIRKYLTDDTQAGMDAGKITTGYMDGARIMDSTMTPAKTKVALVQAQTFLNQGDLVNVYNNGGLYMVRPANASIAGAEANGFVLADTNAGEMAKVYFAGYNDLLSGLSPGAQFLSTLAGKITGLPPSSVGQMVQRVGFAPNATTLNFEPDNAILIVA